MKRTHVRYAAAALSGALLVTGAAVLIAGSGEPSAAQAAAARDQARQDQRGLTDAVTVAQPPGKGAVAATERPATLAPMIRLDPTCKAAADPLRDLIDAAPSGLSLTEAQSTTLNTGLQALDKACTPEQALAFRQQELTPWMSFKPTGDTPPAPSPTKSKPAPSKASSSEAKK